MSDDRDRFVIRSSRGKRNVQMPLGAFIGLLLLLILLMIALWSLKERAEPDLRVGDPGELMTLLPSIVGLTQSSLEHGNSVEVLQNGGLFPAVFRDVATARESVHVEMYIWYESNIARQLAARLANTARRGVKVRVLVDAVGGKELDGETLALLEDAGVEVAHFNPIRLRNLGRVNSRDHRKIIVIDGRIGYVGGHGIADEWTGNAESKKHYRDTALRITGPVVNRLQGAFAENWIEQTGHILADDRYFPRIAPTGSSAVHVAYTSPAGSVSSVQILYYLAIKAARHEILIQNPYMLPDRRALDALAAAVARGVDVRIMVPSVKATDNAIVQHASHHHFGALLKSGVGIWEYDKTLLHQKVIVVDGIWSAVGSTNFDDRSFDINDEVSVGVLDRSIAAELRAAFANDLRFARQRKSDEWENRGLWHKLIDGVAYLGRSQL